MLCQNKVAFNSLKGFLFVTAIIFAVAAALLVILSTSAAVIEGDAPNSAVPLADGVNEGTLSPGEQYWYKFTPSTEGQVAQIEKSLLLTFTPDDGNTIKFINLKLFEEGQIQFFDLGDTSKMTEFGAGQIVSQDKNPETGELFWTGLVSSPTTYYIQLLNESDFLIEYQLISTDIIIRVEPPPAPEPEVPVAEVEAAPIQVGTDPGNPATLTPGLTTGKVQPHSTYWYSFRFGDPNSPDKFKELEFSMFFTPDDGNRRHHVNFELYPFSEFEFWRRGDLDRLTNFGAGMLVSRDGDYNTGERIWHGWVLKGDTYFMAIENGTDVEIDYWVFDGNIINPELGPKPDPAPAPVFARGVAPQTAVPLKLGLNKGGLGPGEEVWYRFYISDFDNENLEEMALTMVATPDDGNRIRTMTFDVFTAAGARDWSPGDNSRINNVGAGSVVYRDNNEQTGERFWHGWVVDGDLYYVQIRNGGNVHMDYWLYTGDVYGPELGEKTKPVVRAAAAPGTAPTAPVELKVGVNQGRLNPEEERWYVFRRDDAQKGSRVETTFTLVFTPDDGNRVRDVNFELFEANQLRDWAPDNRFNLVNFGRGGVVSRDSNFHTGELLWNGHVFAGDTYYMRVSNETDEAIDFWIFPEDIINTSLGG